ncbi:MAG TPA: TrmH family RNA methyltransferase [Bryobacteraceae bacterium]|nr:TrmH family RNA methyltransferase [Bryobacteraceae bacterium]
MNLAVILVAPRNPLNIGAAARAMQNFGCDTLRVVNPYQVAFREAVSAVSAAPLLRAAKEFSAVGEAVADCALVVGTTSIGHRELQHDLHLLAAGASRIRRKMAAGRVGLMFGSEKFGLSNEDMSHCQWLMRIPTVDQSRSMNLGQAVAVCLYEIARSGAGAGPPPKKLKPATMDEIERITQMLLEASRRSGYMNPVVAGSTESKVRRMVRRLRITAPDAAMWLGMLRQILWKLRN